MTLNEFIFKWNEKPCDFDGQFGNQCVDLYRMYCKEVFGIPQSPPVVGAVDIWTTYLKDYFIAIENTPTGVPESGDILIWGTGLGKYGHIGIFLSGDTNSFISFDQNFPVGSVCHSQKHDYKNLIGWLRFKKDYKQIFNSLYVDLKNLVDKYKVV